MFNISIFYSKVNVYGNRYAYCTITNASNGKSVSLQTGYGKCEIDVFLRRLGRVYNIINETELPIRQFNKEAKNMPRIHNANTLSPYIEAIE